MYARCKHCIHWERNFNGNGTHLPILMKIMERSTGPVLELGSGLFSTPYLHWACYESKRNLVSYENNADYFDTWYKNDYHDFRFVEDWDDADIERPWGLALVDHVPHERRVVEIRRIAEYAEYIIIHDSQGVLDWKYHYTTIYPLFKYKYNYRKVRPCSTVLSNFNSLEGL